MKQYLDLIDYVLAHGEARMDRTKTGTIGTFGHQLRFDLRQGFPLLTTKRVHFHSVLVELLWFLKGDTNIKYLVDNKVRIWNEWPYETYKRHADYQGESLAEFVEKIKTDADFAQAHGDLGPVYGRQWRNFNGVDQIQKIIQAIQEKPTSRRHLISAWNPAEVDAMALPPCHSLMQFYVGDDNTTLSLQLYQRSADVFLGVPFNIASYALLLMIVADVCGLQPLEFVHTFGDVHIYNDHIEQIHKQRKRTLKALPTLIIKNHHQNIEDYDIDDFELVGYDPHPHIAGKVSV
ncbi:MAG: thymidylate synthase [Erysipelothrix sp.]|jgi:thymidylate synthase|nr:thymidylate synthase [Erysipelothrix sp.]